MESTGTGTAISPPKAAAPAPPACADMSTHQGLFNICVLHSPGCTSSGPVDPQFATSLVLSSRPRTHDGERRPLTLPFSWPLDAAPYQAGTVALQADAANRTGLVKHGDCASERRAEGSLLWRRAFHSGRGTDPSSWPLAGRWELCAGIHWLPRPKSRAGGVGTELKSRENFGTPFFDVVCTTGSRLWRPCREPCELAQGWSCCPPSLSFFFFSRTMP